MNYGITIISDVSTPEILNIKLYDFNKKILFQLKHDSYQFYPYKIELNEKIFCTPISKNQFYDILNNLKINKRYLNLKDFCLKYDLEELLI